MKWLLALTITVLALPAWSAEPDAVTRAEVAHLLKYLETSGCQFQRNGSWYPPGRASSHLNQKYEYMRCSTSLRPPHSTTRSPSAEIA